MSSSKVKEKEAAKEGAASDPPPAPRKRAAAPVSYLNEVEKMMFTFGDARESDHAASELIEEMVRRYIISLALQAASIAAERSSSKSERAHVPKLTVDDVMFLLRHDISTFRRLQEFLSWKDIRKKARAADKTGDDAGDLDDEEAAAVEEVEIIIPDHDTELHAGPGKVKDGATGPTAVPSPLLKSKPPPKAVPKRSNPPVWELPDILIAGEDDDIDDDILSPLDDMTLPPPALNPSAGNSVSHSTASAGSLAASAGISTASAGNPAMIAGTAAALAASAGTSTTPAGSLATAQLPPAPPAAPAPPASNPIHHQSLDPDTIRRLKVADQVTRQMSRDEYQDYSECRQASFTYRKAKRFLTWAHFSHFDLRVADDVMDVLGFLSWEHVGTLTEAGLVSQRDSLLVAKPHLLEYTSTTATATAHTVTSPSMPTPLQTVPQPAQTGTQPAQTLPQPAQTVPQMSQTGTQPAQIGPLPFPPSAFAVAPPSTPTPTPTPTLPPNATQPQQSTLAPVSAPAVPLLGPSPAPASWGSLIFGAGVAGGVAEGRRKWHVSIGHEGSSMMYPGCTGTADAMFYPTHDNKTPLSAANLREAYRRINIWRRRKVLMR